MPKSERVNWGGDDHQGDGHAENGGGRSAPVASGLAAPSRAGALTGAAADAGRLSPPL